MNDLRKGDWVEWIDLPSVDRECATAKRRFTVESVRKAGRSHIVRLAELTPHCRQGGVCACGKCGWDSSSFRRVYRPRASNLDIFREMLEDDYEPDVWVPGMPPRDWRWS
ncbi:MAG: hypothetical protein ACXWUX_09295 [Allosphingosinicella sp.]